MEDATAVHHTCIHGKASLTGSHKSHFCVCVTARERELRYYSEMTENVLYASLTKTGSERKLYFLPRQLDALLKDYSVTLSVTLFLKSPPLF